MATLTFNVSEEVKKLTETRAAAGGYASVAEYLTGLIEGEAVGAPEQLAVNSNEQLEGLLSYRLDGSSVAMDAGDFRRLREKLTARLDEAVKGVRRGLEDVKQGRTQPVGQAFADIRKKHGIARNPRS
jgi:PHD/YefM family antitoxin component YafN of YafNO toxin-antitoxin module